MGSSQEGVVPEDDEKLLPPDALPPPPVTATAVHPPPPTTPKESSSVISLKTAHKIVTEILEFVTSDSAPSVAEMRMALFQQVRRTEMRQKGLKDMLKLFKIGSELAHSVR